MPNSGPHCSGIGTLNVVDDTCACPLSHEGAQCELPRLPACALGLDVPALRALFWVAYHRLRVGRAARHGAGV